MEFYPIYHVGIYSYLLASLFCECLKSLEEIARHSTVSPILVPDVLTKAGGTLVALTRELHSIADKRWKRKPLAWKSENLYLHKYQRARTVINLSKLHLRNLTLSIQLKRLRLSQSVYGKSCDNAEEEEIPAHFFCHCKVFVQLIRKLFVQRALTNRTCHSKEYLRIIPMYS